MSPAKYNQPHTEVTEEWQELRFSSVLKEWVWYTVDKPTAEHDLRGTEVSKIRARNVTTVYGDWREFT